MNFTISKDTGTVTLQQENGLFFGATKGCYHPTLCSPNEETAAVYDLKRQELLLFNANGFARAFPLVYEKEKFQYLSLSPNGKCLFLVTYVDNQIIRHRIFIITENSLEVESQNDLKEKIHDNTVHMSVFISNRPECVGLCDNGAYSYYSKALETETQSG